MSTLNHCRVIKVVVCLTGVVAVLALSCSNTSLPVRPPAPVTRTLIASALPTSIMRAQRRVEGAMVTEVGVSQTTRMQDTQFEVIFPDHFFRPFPENSWIS
jgi:hypothetical protein